jgi:hypothetical protein
VPTPTPGGTPRPVTISTTIAGLDLTARTLAVPGGTRLVLVGRTTPAMAGRVVHVWMQRTGGTWRDVTTRRVDSNGYVRYAYTAWGDARIQLRWPGDGSFRPARGSVYLVRML